MVCLAPVCKILDLNYSKALEMENLFALVYFKDERKKIHYDKKLDENLMLLKYEDGDFTKLVFF